MCLWTFSSTSVRQYLCWSLTPVCTVCQPGTIRDTTILVRILHSCIELRLCLDWDGRLLVVEKSSYTVLSSCGYQNNDIHTPHCPSNVNIHSTPCIRMLKRSLYKQELEPNWPSPEKVSSTYSTCTYTRVISNCYFSSGTGICG